jgi:hypothetical protein
MTARRSLPLQDILEHRRDKEALARGAQLGSRKQRRLSILGSVERNTAAHRQGLQTRALLTAITPRPRIAVLRGAAT